MNWKLVPLILLLLSSGLAGCTRKPSEAEPTPTSTAAPWETWEPRFGLGLDTASPPPPGRFAENETDLQRLEAFLRSWAPTACGLNHTATVEVFLKDRWYFGAMNTVFDGCMEHNSTATQLQAQQDHDQGVAAQRLADLLVAQGAILNSTIRLIATTPWPDNTVDLEVLGWVMRRVVWLDDVFSQAVGMVANYTAAPSRDAVAGVYANVKVPGDEEFVIRDFIAQYPWAEQPCQVDSSKLHRLRTETWTALNNTIARAALLRPPDEPVDLGYQYGRLVKDFKPSLAFLDEQGWWPAVLWYVSIINASNSYWDHRYDPVLPTLAEASFLLAQYLNQSRNLIRDDQIERWQETLYFWDEDLWRQYPEQAQLVMTTNFPWTYADLPCA